MAQVRDPTFNPSSPHSSSGGADSYKNERTPETRLTVFSPDDSSTRSGRLLTTLSLGPSSEHSVQFHLKPAEGFSDAAANQDRDPFISDTTAPKSGQKLSPTASAFSPVSVPLVAHGSLNGPPGLNVGIGSNCELVAPQATVKFSHEHGASRFLVLYSPSRPLTIADVENYFAVCRLGNLAVHLVMLLTTNIEFGAARIAVPGQTHRGRSGWQGLPSFVQRSGRSQCARQYRAVFS
jgi:hypothetical protein